jgi:hypothetical protein
MRALMVGAAVLCIARVAGAETHDRGPLDARAIVDLGGFFLSTDIRVRLDGETSGNVGDEIDFEDTFGLDRFERFRLDGQWRIKGPHSIRGTYFSSKRSATNELTRDIHFGDETYPVGATATARWELEVMQVSYDYAFKRKDDYELAAGIGIHRLDMNLGMEATIAGAGGSFSRELSESGSTDAPLPVLGLRGVWRLPHDLYFTALAQYFYVDFGDYIGSLSDLKATIVWQATPHFGVGLGYNDFRFKFRLDNDAFSGRLRWNYGGAMAFASVTF